jgi:hypothetical protein
MTHRKNVSAQGTIGHIPIVFIAHVIWNCTVLRPAKPAHRDKLTRLPAETRKHLHLAIGPFGIGWSLSAASHRTPHRQPARILLAPWLWRRLQWLYQWRQFVVNNRRPSLVAVVQMSKVTACRIS